MLNLEGYNPEFVYDKQKISIFDKWILTKLNNLIKETDIDFDNFDYDKVANKIYQFIWGDFCDWYIEITKSKLRSEDDTERQITQDLLVKVLTSSLQLMHPFTPFITEEIYNRLQQFRVSLKSVTGEITKSIVVSAYPTFNESEVFLKEYKYVEFLKQIVVSIRNIRAELGVMPAQRIKILIHPDSDKTHDLISDNKHFIYELAGVDSVEFAGDEKPKNCVTQVLSGVEIFVPVEGIIDLDSEISRINREVSKIDVDLKFIEDKLNNKKFIERAPKEIVEKEKNKFKEFSDNKSRMLEVLNRLSQIK